MRRSPLPILVWLISQTLAGALRADEPVAVDVIADPPQLTLMGPSSRHGLLVHGKTANGRLLDLTRSAQFQSQNDKIATVAANGVVRGIADGQTTVQVQVRGRSLSVPVLVRGAATPRQFHFENDIVPLLDRFGCNSSGCHGKAEGQNGFKLSVFGFDPAADYSALLKEGRGRRLFPAVPEKSLLLTKASGQVAHGGGNRIPANSQAFETMRAWIAAGAPYGDADAARVKSIRVEPNERILSMGAGQQLRIIARFTNGRELDATSNARFQTNNEAVATVGADGFVQAADIPGEATIMAAFLNEVASFRLLVPRPGVVDYPKLPANNFIDSLVDAKLKKLNVAPSGPIDDSTFVRRVFIDMIGTLPTAAETRTFLKDPRADKRAKLVDDLLDRPEYADYWALKWSDLLRVDRSILSHKRAYAYYRWIRDGFAENKPFDRFARELATAEGLVDETPAANFFMVMRKPGEAVSAISQVFLGIRIACAECHHHPFDRWSQDDYYRMSAYFAPLGWSRIGAADALLANGASSAINSRTNEALTPSPLGTHVPKLSAAAQLLGAKQAPPNDKGDQRRAFADWLVSPRNPWFARNIANRYWAHFMGRGIVEPVDDVRATNPPSNPELLAALAKHLDEANYDPKKLIRTIVLSRVYQTSSQPNDTNEKDEQNFSRHLFKRIDAEVFLDMVCQTTGVAEKFQGVPAGTRAIQLWDSKVRHYFLKTFGRPVRASTCECERIDEPNIAQILHLLNSDLITNKLQNEGGAVARLTRDINDDGKLTEELFMIFLSRAPTEKEKTAVAAHLRNSEAGKRRQGVEDIAWALLNSKEFMFNH
jgi:hypothetical protein